MANALGFKQHDPAPALRRGQCRRHAGEAAANDDEVGVDVTGEWRLRRE